METGRDRCVVHESQVSERDLGDLCAWEARKREARRDVKLVKRRDQCRDAGPERSFVFCWSLGFDDGDVYA